MERVGCFSQGPRCILALCQLLALGIPMVICSVISFVLSALPKQQTPFFPVVLQAIGFPTLLDRPYQTPLTSTPAGRKREVGEGLTCENDQQLWDARRVSAGYMAREVGCLHVGVSPPVPPQPSLHPLYPTLPACNVTIHNRCKDTLANCTKVKQKVRWQGGQRACGEGSAIPAGLSTHSSSYVPLLDMGYPRPSAYGNAVLPH